MKPPRTKGQKMKLTIWTIKETSDVDVYSLMARTKKQVLAQYWQEFSTSLEPVIQKQVIEFKDSFDLFDLATGEGGGRTIAGLTESRYLITPKGAKKIPLDFYDYEEIEAQRDINDQHNKLFS